MLRLNRLQFTSFRSYREFRLLCDSDIVIITGPNAVGKTNIVEGIQLVTGIESFRTSHWAELPTWGSTQARVEASIGGDGRDLNLSLQIEGNKRTYVLNGKRRRASQLRGTLPVVLFTPDDLQLVKSDAQQRRNTLDSIGIQLSSTYASLKADYEKAVRQRNHLLKEEHLNVDIINSWTIWSLTIFSLGIFTNAAMSVSELSEAGMSIFLYFFLIWTSSCPCMGELPKRRHQQVIRIK